MWIAAGMNGDYPEKGIRGRGARRCWNCWGTSCWGREHGTRGFVMLLRVVSGCRCEASVNGRAVNVLGHILGGQVEAVVAALDDWSCLVPCVLRSA